MIALNLSCGALGSAPLSMVKLKLIQIGGLIPAIYIFIYKLKSTTTNLQESFKKKRWWRHLTKLYFKTNSK